MCVCGVYVCMCMCMNVCVCLYGCICMHAHSCLCVHVLHSSAPPLLIGGRGGEPKFSGAKGWGSENFP